MTGISDLHLDRQQDLAENFLAGRITEQDFRAGMARLGFDGWWIDDMLDDMRETRRENAWATVRWIAFVVAGGAYLACLGWYLRVVAF